MTYSVKRNCITAAIILCVVLMIGCIYAYAKTPDKELPSRNKYFTSIEIQPGDTLHGIAGKYMSYEYSSESSYIDEVKSINGFVSNTLFAGAFIVVPYYAD